MEDQPGINLPENLEYSVQFDECYGEPATVEVFSNGCDTELWCDADGGDTKLLSTYRDQWGVYIDFCGINIAQEDGTRSFLDALIKALQLIRSRNEFQTTEATVLVHR